jgi:flagellar L-ring protein precursor FlgH
MKPFRAPAARRPESGRTYCALVGAALCASLASGCASAPSTIVQGPLTAPPVSRPASIERVITGSLFQPDMASLYSGRKKPRHIGDTLKVDISESLRASNTVRNDMQRQSAFSSKGPGNADSTNLLSGLMNQNISGSGSTSFKGDGTTKNDSSFTGQMAASVINVLSNGNLVIAGERSISLSGSVSTMRFSGIVDPKDIRDGNIIVSGDVVNARLEVVGQGDMADNTTRNWLQRVLTNNLAVW